MPTFGDRLRELRTNAGLTQSGLAEASGLPLGSIRNYEQGQREPLWDVVFRLADAMGVSCESFKGCAGASADAEPRGRGRPRKEEAEAPKAKKPAAKGKRKK